VILQNNPEALKNVRILGVDTGGTFTDFVYYANGQLAIHKVLSTPAAPEQAILQGIKDLGLDTQLAGLVIVHGSTVATNAALERKGVKTAYITNRGLADVLTIGRQARKELYNLSPAPKIAPVPRHLCFEVNSRVDAKGQVLESLNQEELDRLKRWISEHQPEAVAINLLFSFLNDQDERLIESELKQHEPGLFISRSSAVLPEYKEYERGIATWLNAWIGPRVQGYVQRLTQGTRPAQLSVMQSSGGTIAADQAAEHAVRMLLSGPAGGLAGARYIANTIAGDGQQKNLLTFDMGGTSTDVAVIEGELQLTNEGHIGDYPVAIPMVDMHTIGAGGGSIASVDEGGALQVGPESAGAAPGPVCYGLGGRQVTVTDANLVLGRLSADAFLGGEMLLDETASRTAMAKLAQQLQLAGEQAVEKAAEGVIQVANEHMSRALRVMSIQRGIDPKGLILVPFGGAGALHVCALANNLQMSKALVPVHAGVLSALGMVVAPHTRDLSHTINEILTPVPGDQDDAQSKNRLRVQQLNDELEKLARQGEQELVDEGIERSSIRIQYSLDLRYQGQSYTLNVPWSDVQTAIDDFHRLHFKRYGHQHQQPVEVVNVRVKASADALSLRLPALEPVDNAKPESERYIYGVKSPVPIFQREKLAAGQRMTGPALIVERVSTTWLAPKWACQVDAIGNLHLNRTDA
jgi:N-methylhydantoinase A